MSRLSERLDYVLAYGVEGNENLEQLQTNLSSLEERGTNVNELTERSREIMAAKAEADRAAADATGKLAEKQFDLATAVSNANEVVRDVTIGAELLRLEFDEGQISQEEYQIGLAELRERLEELDIITMSSVRATRSLSNEQQKFGQVSRGTVRDLNRQQQVLASTGRLFTQMPTNIRGAANQLPMLIRHLNTLEASSTSAGGGLASIVGFMTSPAGIAVAVAALIPVLIAANERFNLFATTLWDVEEAGKAATSIFKEAREEILKMLDLQGVEQLEKELQLINQQIEQMESDPGRRTFFERSLITLSQWLPNIEINRAALRALQSESQSREEIINGLLEERASIRSRLVGHRIAEANEATKMERLEARMVELTRQAREEWAKLLSEFSLEDDEIIDDAEDRQRRLAEQEQRHAERRISVARQRLQFEQQLEQMRFDNAVRGLDAREQLAMREQRMIQQINEDEILTERQKQEAITEIERQHAHERAEIAKTEEEEKRLAKELTHDLAVELLASLQGFGEVIFGQSRERARQAFELNKALALATAIVQGGQAVVRAYAEGGLTDGILVAGAVAAQIAKIAATKFRERATGAGSRGSRGGGITHEFRGAKSQAVPGIKMPEFPNELMLKDNAGRFLTKLELARDKAGESAYLTKKGQS